MKLILSSILSTALAHLLENNIVTDAYSTWLWNFSQKKLEDQRPSWDLATVYYAVEGYGDFLEKEQDDWLDFDAQNGSRWETGENSFKHQYIIQKEGVQGDFAETLNKLLIIE